MRTQIFLLMSTTSLIIGNVNKKKEVHNNEYNFPREDDWGKSSSSGITCSSRKFKTVCRGGTGCGVDDHGGYSCDLRDHAVHHDLGDVFVLLSRSRGWP
jgi:hypothetical protein